MSISETQIRSKRSKGFSLVACLVVMLCCASSAWAAVPGIVSYQGRVLVSNAPYSGTGKFKFALVDAAGTTTYWSHDGANGEPANTIDITVTNGLYSVLLGDTSITNMTVIPTSVFSNSDVRLRIWFDDGTATGNKLLAPDQRIAAVGYALRAATVNNLTFHPTAYRVGIGENNPTARLHIATDQEGALAVNDNRNPGNSSSAIITGKGNKEVLRVVNTGAAGEAAFFSLQDVNSNHSILYLEGKNSNGYALTIQTDAQAFLYRNIAGQHKIRFDNNGTGFFNGGVQLSGADIAEAFEVIGSRKNYGAGDVLALSPDVEGKVQKCAKPYSSLVSGVFATKPGILLTERGIQDNMSDTVPMGVVGVIPTKVTTENGPIKIGDLLVTSSTAGHAMKGTDRSRMLGATIGKAMQSFDGKKGVIKVLVNAK